jgi:glyoxylase-like metal-dependent hydrolase (beta-lactamase superfamily II)
MFTHVVRFSSKPPGTTRPSGAVAPRELIRAMVEEVAESVTLVTAFPPYAINCYVAGDLLVDAMTRLDAGRILKACAGRTISAHVATHAHPDHVGASHQVCTKLGVPLWCHADDAPAVEDIDEIERRQPDALINKVFAKVMLGPGHPVARTLAEGDVVSGFTVLHVPGHSVGHIALFRESDKVLILGDVLNNQHPLLGFPRGLRLPLDTFTPDPATNRASAKRLGELGAEVILFGHGPPLRDGARFRAFCRAL